MSVVTIRVDARGVGVADDLLRRLNPLDASVLMQGLGRLIQQQTRRRIQFEKTSPSGAAWKANRTGTSILLRSGALMRSIDYAAGAAHVIVGSGLVYARIHQQGGVIRPKTAKVLAFRAPWGRNGVAFAAYVKIPARAYLGVSGANAAEIMEATADFIRRKLGL